MWPFIESVHRFIVDSQMNVVVFITSMMIYSGSVFVQVIHSDRSFRCSRPDLLSYLYHLLNCPLSNNQNNQSRVIPISSPGDSHSLFYSRSVISFWRLFFLRSSNQSQRGNIEKWLEDHETYWTVHLSRDIPAGTLISPQYLLRVCTDKRNYITLLNFLSLQS